MNSPAGTNSIVAPSIGEILLEPIPSVCTAVGRGVSVGLGVNVAGGRTVSAGLGDIVGVLVRVTVGTIVVGAVATTRVGVTDGWLFTIPFTTTPLPQQAQANLGVIAFAQKLLAVLGEQQQPTAAWQVNQNPWSAIGLRHSDEHFHRANQRS